MPTLQESIDLGIKPVILIDFFFDGGTIRIWTRPFKGEFEGEEYSPLAGITSSLAIRQSLEQPSLSLAAEITGTADEIVAAGLTEEFQLRDATVRLGNINAAGVVDAAEILIEGTMQDIPIIDDVGDSSVAVQIQSLFSEIDRAIDIRNSAADQKKKIDPTDTFYDFIESVTNGPVFGA